MWEGAKRRDVDGKLSDGSAANYTDMTTGASGQYDRNYTLSYAARRRGKPGSDLGDEFGATAM